MKYMCSHLATHIIQSEIYSYHMHIIYFYNTNKQKIKKQGGGVL